MLNLSCHEDDFGIKAAWTFTSSGHGKSGCDGLGAVVKSGGRKHSLKGGSEAAFTTAKDFYAFALKKYSRAPHQPKVTHSNESSDASSITTNDELTDDEMDTISTNSKSSIEVRWLDADEVEETFEQHLKNRWKKLSGKNRIVGIRSFHQFDVLSTGVMACKSTSVSLDSKIFHFDQQCNKHYNSLVKRLLNSDDFSIDVFLIVELSNNLHLARINRNGLYNNQIQTLIYLPSLPAKKLSTSKSSITLISINNVVGSLNQPPMQITANKVTLSNEQLASIQDICDEL
ncbi:unnamed protein product [Adineta ricciae]|uniref:Uncharacterized protein n=1 Tax=Adineta ricciae TaxID=249248 RepID=A0A815S6E9_ADIRI|nr:unnamed protein product [Adineta ricciae]